VLRFFLLSNHYRAPLEFSDASLKAAQAAVQRIAELLAKVFGATSASGDGGALTQAVHEARHAVEEAMDDDLNTAAAFGAVFSLISAANTAFAQRRVDSDARESLASFFTFLAERFGIVPEGGSPLPDDVRALVDERQTAREQKDWATSDQLRDRLGELGYTVDDTPYGPLVKSR